MKDFTKFRDPFFMAGGLLIVFLFIFLSHLLIVLISGDVMDYLNIWIYVMGSALVFSIFSTINLLYADNTASYYNKTLLAFALLILLGGLIASLISGQSIFNLPTYRKVMIFVVIAFLVFISIATLMKRFEEWSRKL